MSYQKGNAKMTNYRWVVCAMLFFATTVNYLDRQVLSLTFEDFIRPEFHWTDSDYGNITGIFSLFYAIAMLVAGKFVDWMGTKKGYMWAMMNRVLLIRAIRATSSASVVRRIAVASGKPTIPSVMMPQRAWIHAPNDHTPIAHM